MGTGNWILGKLESDTTCPDPQKMVYRLEDRMTLAPRSSVSLGYHDDDEGNPWDYMGFGSWLKLWVSLNGPTISWTGGWREKWEAEVLGEGEGSEGRGVWWQEGKYGKNRKICYTWEQVNLHGFGYSRSHAACKIHAITIMLNYSCVIHLIDLSSDLLYLLQSTGIRNIPIEEMMK